MAELTFREQEEANMIGRRNGSNLPLHMRLASWDGYRSVRLSMGEREVGLATATYSYQLTNDERCDTARRIAALWNLAAAKGWETREIEVAARRALEDRS